MRGYLRKHRRVAWSVGTALVLGVIFVLVWFQPQKLFIEETVDEQAPQAEQEEGPTAPDDETSSSSTLLTGMFQSLEHETTGHAKVIELSDRRRFLRLEDFITSNGPDLRVYLSEIPASNDWHVYGERFIDLGALKGNRGNQNYEIPSGTDLSRFKSAVIWCRRFTVGFGVAGLS